MLVSIFILGMVLVLIHEELFHCQKVVGMKKKVMIIGVNNSFSVRADNRKKDILILGKGPADGLDNTTITTEAEYTLMEATVFCLLME